MSRSKGGPSPEQGLFEKFRWELIVCAVLAVAVWFVFAQTTDHGMINLDDYDYVNPAVMAGLTWEGIQFAFRTKISANWHPLTWISYMVDVSLFNGSAGAIHGMNGWIHACNAVLLFWLLRIATGALWRSAAVALLFAVHPLHVEPVAWLSERKDVLATFFWLATALAWVKDRRMAAHILAALAMMSKPTTVTLPFTLLLLDAWPLGRWKSAGDLPRLIKEKALLFLMAAGLAVITFQVQRELGATQSLAGVGTADRLGNVVLSYGTYLWQMLWPVGLCPMYPFPLRMPWTQVALSGAVLIAVTVFVISRMKRQPYLAAGWFWYLGVLVPMIGLVQVGVQSHADRYTYVSLIGVFWMIAWGLHDALPRLDWKGPLARGAMAAVFGGLTWAAHQQAALWSDDLTLFGHTLRVTRDNRMANTIVGLAFLRGKQPDAAISYLRTSLTIDPNFAPSHRHMAEALFAKGRNDEALAALNRAIELEPREPLSYYNRGILLKTLERHSDALADLEKAIGMGLPDDERKRAFLEAGLVSGKLRRDEDALKWFQKAVDEDPNYYLGLKNLGYARFRMSMYRESQHVFLRLATMRKDDPDVRNMLRELSKVLVTKK